MSRALSVHQGKGATEADARIGALLEAVESDAAERFAAETVTCRFDALPGSRRAPSLGDFALDRADPPAPEIAHDWVEAGTLGDGDRLFLPFDLVSLDFTRAVPSRFDRGSNGLGSAATRDEAIAVAIHELIERDAVTEWRAGDLLDVMETSLDLDTVPFGWFAALRDRIAGAGASLLAFAVPSVTGTPVFACELNDGGKSGRPYRAVQGRGAHPLPEVALFKAVAEAVQGRATFIAGARDDVLPSVYAASERGITIAFGLPLPPGMDGVDFSAVSSGPAALDALAQALAAAGHDRIAVVDLAAPDGLSVVRAFVPGLGSLTRRRRTRP